jgi:hypothetical protein
VSFRRLPQTPIANIGTTYLEYVEEEQIQRHKNTYIPMGRGEIKTLDRTFISFHDARTAGAQQRYHKTRKS